MYVHRNIGARSCKDCCSRKSICITNSECASVALSIQHVMRMRHIVVCVLVDSTIFIHVISQTARFSKKKKSVVGYEMPVLGFSTTDTRSISHFIRTERDVNNMYIGLHVKFSRYSFHILMKF